MAKKNNYDVIGSCWRMSESMQSMLPSAEDRANMSKKQLRAMLREVKKAERQVEKERIEKERLIQQCTDILDGVSPIEAFFRDAKGWLKSLSPRRIYLRFFASDKEKIDALLEENQDAAQRYQEEHGIE